MEKLINKFRKSEKIAVIGASDNKSKYGYKVYMKLKKERYNVFPVNPNKNSINGDKVHDSITEIEDKIDSVSIVVNPKIGKKVIREVKKEGITLVWFQPGAYDSKILEYCKNNNIEVIYERCVLVDL